MTQQRDASSSKRQLQGIAYDLSRQIIEMTTEAGSGHPSSSLSMIDILTVLYFGGIMNYDPHNPNWSERDRFILSKGHGVPALYATLAKAEYFDSHLLDTLREIGSPLEGHPNMRRLAGVEASTGSLGQGLSIAVGHALAARLDKRDYRVYVLIGDGEADEGQIWEAAMTAAKYNLDNLTLIVDYNKFQQTGAISDVMPALKPLADKWRAFEWHTQEINGHNLEDIATAFDRAKSVQGNPQVIVAHTKKGKGLTPFQKDDTNRRHGEVLSEDEAQVALTELDKRFKAHEEV